MVKKNDITELGSLLQNDWSMPNSAELESLREEAREEFERQAWAIITRLTKRLFDLENHVVELECKLGNVSSGRETKNDTLLIKEETDGESSPPKRHDDGTVNYDDPWGNGSSWSGTPPWG